MLAAMGQLVLPELAAQAWRQLAQRANTTPCPYGSISSVCQVSLPQ